MKSIRPFQFTIVAAIVIVSLIGLDQIIGSDFFASMVNLIERMLSVETDHIIIPAALILVAIIADLSSQSRRRKTAKADSLLQQQKEIADQRLKVLKATMLTVHDIVGNMQQGLQLFRVQYEDTWPEEEVKLFDKLIFDTAARLKQLGDLESTPEIEMAAGIGIDYEGIMESLGNKAGLPTLRAELPITLKERNRQIS